MRPFVATTTGPLLAQLATRFHSDVVQGTGNKMSVKDIISSKCVIVKQKTSVKQAYQVYVVVIYF